ncbi:MAG: GIY-YIG nuclease family protein [Candidatus Liptonbacteria bacterium]|nr:GIY-YIG nuclease family protein [Candidatus Liptonbacteria bacterium]
MKKHRQKGILKKQFVWPDSQVVRSWLRQISRSETVLRFFSRYYVYFLLSFANKDLYIGSTANLEKRVSLHNAGKVKSTRAYRPWKLLGHERHETRSEAVRREVFLKNHQQKEILKRRFGLAA